MIQRIVFVVGAIIFLFSCSEKNKELKKKELYATKKIELIAELKKMKEQDQKNRSYISLGIFDQKKIDSIQNLSPAEYFAFKKTNKPVITRTQRDSLWNIQKAIDLKNTNRLYEITKEYGWLSIAKLDSIIDPMIFLFHTPLETIDKMQSLLLSEVKKGRMEPVKYATYIDNMRVKAFGENQLYGTGDEFDLKTNAIVPPLIENIDSTNMERKKIGLSKLKEGEYRIEN